MQKLLPVFDFKMKAPKILVLFRCKDWHYLGIVNSVIVARIYHEI